MSILSYPPVILPNEYLNHCWTTIRWLVRRPKIPRANIFWRLFKWLYDDNVTVDNDFNRNKRATIPWSNSYRIANELNAMYRLKTGKQGDEGRRWWWRQTPGSRYNNGTWEAFAVVWQREELASNKFVLRKMEFCVETYNDSTQHIFISFCVFYCCSWHFSSPQCRSLHSSMFSFYYRRASISGVWCSVSLQIKIETNKT